MVLSQLLFSIHNGMIQDCPISPYLYVLVMEPLPIHLDKTYPLEDAEDHKLCLFADDLLLYVTSARVCLPVIRHVFQRYGMVSNFKVNVPKFVLLKISLLSVEV